MEMSKTGTVEIRILRDGGARGRRVSGLTGGVSVSNAREVNPGISLRCWRRLARPAVLLGGLVLFAMEARAVSLTLVVTNITMPSGRTFQMPLSGFDPDGQPLRFSATVSNKKAVTAAFAPSTNPSLVLNVSGVDSNNQAFTGNIALQLFKDLTPLTTARISDLVNSNFYNGLLFYRVIAGFVAQGGGATNNLNFESGVPLDDEYEKTLIYDGFGQLGMANLGGLQHDSNDSQFFITDIDLSIDNPTNTSPESLNFVNPIFGQLTSGFDIFSEMMSTPVGPNPDSMENSLPLSNVVINTATIITNSQDGVLRLTAAPKFTGMVTVTINATNAENQVATQTLQVKVIANTDNSPPFLGPIPSNIILTQNTVASFILQTTDIDGDHVLLANGYGDSFLSTSNLATTQVLTNIATAFDLRTGQIWFDPDVALTGVVSIVIGVTDPDHDPNLPNIQTPNFDTQIFSLTILPRSTSPTMSITQLKGIIKDSSKPGGDSINVSGKFTFTGGSDGTFGSNDIVSLSLGNPTMPLTVAVGPDSTGYKFSNGTISAKGIVVSGLDNNVTVSAQFNSRSGTFKISVKGFDFPAAILNQVQIGIAVGDDYVTDVRTWVQEKPGIFMPPP
jgi:cyclophilin family peptidyl-prolyl cis-trans isomerase